jgi:hypothetical protein
MPASRLDKSLGKSNIFLFQFKFCSTRDFYELIICTELDVQEKSTF